MNATRALHVVVQRLASQIICGVTLLELFQPLTSLRAQQRGDAYTSRVRVVEGSASAVTATVEGSDIYDVEITHAADRVKAQCSCPYFIDQGRICKHLWAVALRCRGQWLDHLPPSATVDLELDDYDFLGDVDEPPAIARGRPDAGRASISPVPRVSVDPWRRPPPRPEWLTVLTQLDPALDPLAHTTASRGGELLYVISAPAGATLTEIPLTIERRERKKSGEWSKPQPARLSFESIRHLPDESDRWALSLIHASSTYPRHFGSGYAMGFQPLGPTYLRAALVDLLMPRLCATGRLRLRHTAGPYAGGPSESEDATLVWEGDQPWQFEVAVTAGDALTVTGRMRRGDDLVSLQEFALITDSIAIRQNVAAPCLSSGGWSWLIQLRQRGVFTVPLASANELIDVLARSDLHAIDLPEHLRWETRVVPPRFRLAIGAPLRAYASCTVECAVEYEDVRAPFDGRSRLVSPDGRVVYRRDAAAEQSALGRLRQLGVIGLERHLELPPTIPERRVATLVHTLVAEGWTVEAEGVRVRPLSTPRLRIRSGIDWFDLDLTSGTNTAIDLTDLLAALKSGRRTVRLGDGSVGMLPEEWLARVAPALSLGEVDGDRLRFKPSQAALVDALLAQEPEVDWDEGFRRAREKLAGFAGVAAEMPVSSFAGELRLYQRESLGWMRFLRDFGFGGCLADDMGLGKTVMVLAMLEGRRQQMDRANRTSLIVLPRSLLFNWQSEAARFVPQLRVLDFAHADRHRGAEAVSEADLLLTTYGTLRRDVTTLSQRRFDYVILDEAQAIKNAGTATAKAVRLLHADHRLALTGTPVENHLGELQSLFDFLNPGLLGKGKVLDVKHTNGQPSPEQIHALATGLRPFFLRRTKEQVAPELPARTEETLYCELETGQRRLYDQLRDHYRGVLLKMVDRQGLAKSKLQVLEALLRLRQAACHPALLDGRLRAVARRSAAPEPSPSSSAKFDVLLSRVQELVAEGRKALVFSQFTSLLALLRERLHAANIVYEYLDGDTRDRSTPVARFQEDSSCPLFLISLKAGGVGLNLTAAEYVFLLDPWWNPAVEAQAIDRTHRIGQRKPVFAYRLVARDTVEERILELQSRKRELADAILDAGTGGLRGLQREDLEQLLS